MIIEILYSEVCGLFGDSQNPEYLKATLPDAQFVYTDLNREPYFAKNDVDMIYLGAMTESTQRKVIDRLMPHRNRILELIEKNVPILATGNAGEIFCRKIEYVTEDLVSEGLGIFDLDVKTDHFDRYNGKVIAKVADSTEDITVVGFRSQFSFIYGDNSRCFFAECERGDGINRESRLEGLRKNNLMVTQIIGPILPLNPLFTEYLCRLAGAEAKAAYRDAAMAAYEQRVAEFRNPDVVFGNNM